MPQYTYRCLSCEKEFDVYKSMSESGRKEPCDFCEGETQQLIKGFTFYGASDWDKASYNPGLGCITKNSRHAAKIARERGLIEVGNEDLGKTMASQEAKLESIQNERFENAFKPVAKGLAEGIKR